MESKTKTLKIRIPSTTPINTKNVLINIINHVRENLLELIKEMSLYQLEQYKYSISKILATNELNMLEIKVEYEAIYDDIIASYDVSDIRKIEVEPREFDLKIIVWLKNNVDITLYFTPISTRFMAKETFEKFEQLVVNYTNKLDNIIKKKKEEEEKKKRIYEILDKIWNYYDIKQAIQSVINKYDVDVQDVEKLVNDIVFELKRLNKIINDKDNYIATLEEENIIMRRFINEKGYDNEFIKWYIETKEEDIHEDLEQEAKKIIRYEEEDDDC